ncbi:hypothetical protein MAP00_003879 [Monascus purpureus]|nr:hypothetical protein MAP00_003879 [Monascus purpureus]
MNALHLEAPETPQEEEPEEGFASPPVAGKFDRSDMLDIYLHFPTQYELLDCQGSSGYRQEE